MTTNPHRFRFAYPARLTLDEDGRILIEFPDFPFAATDAADMEDVGTQGTDCLEEALAVCIDEGLPIPVPPDDLDCWPFDKSSGDPDDWGRAVLTPGPVIAAKAALYQAVRDAGMEMCSGGIVGMGESDADVVQLALVLRDLGVHSIPVNFLNPIDGTPLEGVRHLNPRYCLKVLCLFRMANPDREIRIAGGRELHLGSLQPLGLYAANSLFVGDYLTTKGQSPEADYRMIEQLGFEVTQFT